MLRTVMLLQEENDQVIERMELTRERLQMITNEEVVKQPYCSYFKKMAKFLLILFQKADDTLKESWKERTQEELKEENEALYEDIMGQAYDTSYGNPSYAGKLFGEHYGPLLSFLYAQIRSTIPCAFEYRLTPLVITSELFIEIYNYFEEENEYTYKDIKRAIYYFVHDYSEDFIEFRTREITDPSYTFAYDLIMESDLNDLTYLYRYGEYISDNERQIAAFLNQRSESEVKAMAETYVNGYIRGFEVMGADLSKKSIVALRTVIGFERMLKYAIKQFEAIGKKVVIYRVAQDPINRRYGRKNGYHATSANPQYEYDHRYDMGIYLDANLKERILTSNKAANERYKAEFSKYAGPAVIETFGELDFEPINKKEAVCLDQKQQKLQTELSVELSQIMNEYIPSEETSFTIIAYPLPSIGEKFNEIFEETVKVNTLNNEEYQNIQQHLIDALDQGVSCEIIGAGKNDTNLMVSLHPLKNPDKETIFENCRADVNIPVGEVFTSPRLTGTNGRLTVSKVFLNGLEYRDLTIDFQDGMIASYTCSNFSEEEENKKFIKENILMNRETLPLGEFAIGTNTTAYAMGIKYDIQKKLPILIAEKTGPHFAVGDTCYSHSEDHKVYNPDGKEIIARENEFSAKRKEDPMNAYVNCHTDITIPYDEIKRISVVKPDQSRIDLIVDGKFVLPGTTQLNKPLEQLQ